MKNGDLYRMQGLLKTGSSLDDVINRFKNRYSREEIESFLTPPKRRGRPKKTYEEDDE